MKLYNSYCPYCRPSRLLLVLLLHFQMASQLCYCSSPEDLVQQELLLFAAAVFWQSPVHHSVHN